MAHSLSSQNSPYPDECYSIDGRGVEFTCLVPMMKTVYTSFERHYDPSPVLELMQRNAYIPFVSIAAYFLAIWLGQRCMRDREPFQWKSQLALWNMSLSLFSMAGTCRLLPHLIYNMKVLSFRDIMCKHPRETFGIGSSGLWVQLFILSKFPELFDTFFIVIHKKPLLFLHWYHHSSVLLYCWHSYTNERASGLFFMVMNYGTHSMMYGYYFLSCVGMKPKWFKGSFITKIQICQMFLGILVTLLGFRLSLTDKNCIVSRELNVAAFLMYGTYLFLYCSFYLKKYILKVKMGKLHSS